MMKKTYMNPELTYTLVDTMDILTLSGNDDGKNDIFFDSSIIIFE